ncbi:MAG TPA: DUF2147 domain-containing protein [Dyella sp.]|nr:DUF2147 domain-containing protein [Dyella sp.]
MKLLSRFTLATGLLLIAGSAFAATDTPVGTWKTIDDKTHQPKSIVEITENNGELQAKVIKVLNSDEGPNPICKECEGERKNQPIEGMTIMWGVTKDDDVWDGGKILDPKNGKEYKVKLTLTDGGQKLDVHGYIGFALLGRSQVWERQE